MPLNHKAMAKDRLVRGLRLIREANRISPLYTKKALRSYIMATFTDLESAWNFLEPLIPDLATRTAMGNIISLANTLSAAGVTSNGLPPASGTGTDTTTGGAASDPTTTVTNASAASAPTTA